MKPRNFENLQVNGVRLRVVVEGQGPLVIFVHGWPQCWYLWRHLIDPVVAAGYRVAVPDMRGFGGSDAPPAVEDYTVRTLAADVAGIATALGEEQFVVIGHDWGCIVAWYTALLHPDRCRAVMGMSVPFWRMGPETVDPPGKDAAFWYMRYFQTPGVAEAELDANVRNTLKRVYYSVCARAGQMAFFEQFNHPRDAKLLEVFPAPDTMEDFMTSEDWDYMVAAYKLSGFRGGLNWYRNISTTSSSTPELDGRKITQPAAFVAGAVDPVLLFDPEWREHFTPCFDDLRFVELIEDAGHWLQLEQPAAVATSVLRFLGAIDR
ncbi:MAG: alpha/beta hydrolase [Denitromonas halophila]|nr:MAG: alpha/beta hydrolase [Denitromonas halophila]